MVGEARELRAEGHDERLAASLAAAEAAVDALVDRLLREEESRRAA